MTAQPAMPIECPICSKIPNECSRSHWYDEGVPEHHDNTPPEIERLVELDAVPSTGSSVIRVLRCPTCQRLYIRQTDFVGENTMTSWRRQDAIEHPGDRPPSTGQVEPIARRAGDRVIVTKWIASPPQLIRRDITVQADGHHSSVDTVVVRDTFARPPTTFAPIFASLDAFRAICGAPTMPLEQCPICTRIPESCYDSEAWPPELKSLEHFVGEDIQRCPTCHRLYFYEDVPLGNDIYTGNDHSEHYLRRDVDALFDLEWCVRQRLPEWGIGSVSQDRFFAHHVLVNIGYGSVYGALGQDNRLVVLDGHDAITTLIARDPPRVTHDLELATRYALFIDKLECPGDDRPEYLSSLGWGMSWTPEQRRRIADVQGVIRLSKGFVADASEKMPRAAERAGDRVIVRLWVTSNQRLIQRSITLYPDGHHDRQDTVIAENLPIR